VKPLALGAALLALLALVPLVAAKYHVTLMIPFFSYGIALLGLNLLFGTAGLLSFGHAMFLGIGAYTAAVFTGKWGLRSFELILLASAAVAALVALPIGALCVRYTKIFFGMLTLAFGMLFHSFLFKFYAITGGDEGMTVRRPSLLGQNLAGLDKTSFLAGPFYYYCLALLALLAFLMWRITRSPFGLHLRALRDNPVKAAYLGVRVRLSRLCAFVVSAAYGAIGGAILAVNIGLADPELAYWTQSGNLVFMTVLGGFGNFLGPLVGALAFIFLQDQLMSATQYWRFGMGAILAAIVILLPRGITGLAVDIVLRPARLRLAKARA
jgi:branched-chain amino acid transport system permease protein